MTDWTQERVTQAQELLPSYLLFLGAAVLLIFAFAAPVFTVTNINVVGRGLPVRQIVDASEVQGRNVFTIRGASVATHLQRVPNILVTGVDLSLPSTVTIHALVRRPILGWRQKSILLLIDKYGRLIERTAATKLPIIHNNTPTTVGLGRYIPSSIEVAASYVRHALPGAGINGFSLDVKRGLILHSSQGWNADLGRPVGRGLVTRVAMLKEVISTTAQAGKRLIFVDLRSQAPYVSAY